MVGFTSNRHLTGFAKSLHCLSRSLPAVLVATALVWTAGSTLAVYPHQLAYFNELAGGPENGHRHLLGSSLDWGQDLILLHDRSEANATVSPNLLFYGSFDPVAIDMTYQFPFEAAKLNPSLPPGAYFVSISLLQGQRADLPTGQNTTVRIKDAVYEALRRSRPVSRVGYSLVLVEVAASPSESI